MNIPMPVVGPKQHLIKMIEHARQRVRFHRIAKTLGPGIERQSRIAIDDAKRDMRGAWHVFNRCRHAPEAHD